MLRKIKLYGELAKFLGQKTFEAEVHNAAQAIRFLVVNFPQLEKHMADRHYKVSIADWDLTEKQLHYPNGQEDIRIIPVVGGAGGNGGLGRFILGAALIGAAFIPGLQGISIGTFGGEALKLSTLVGTIGASLAFQGLAQMLTPVETIPEREQDPRLSFNFS